MIDPRDRWGQTRGAPGRRAALSLLAALSVAALSGCSAAPEGGEGEARTIVGRRGAIEFSVTPLAPPAEGANTFQVRLVERGSQSPVEGAELRVVALMPSMGHEATTAPRVEEIAPGLYEVTGVVFTMPGTWEVRYRTAGAPVEDEAAFRYEVR
jgi:hypothetical protein